MDIGITRIDHQNISGYGDIGTLGITLKDDISTLKLSGPVYKTLMLKAKQIKAINKNEALLSLNAGEDSVVVTNNPSITGIHSSTLDKSGIKVYPNPASGSLNLDINSADVKEIRMLNMIGEIV